MQIEVRKIKATKSLINQMRVAERGDLGGDVLGFMIGVRKSMQRSVLIKNGNEYCVLAMNWNVSSSGKGFFRSSNKWSQEWKFDSRVMCDTVWRSYQLVLEEAKKKGQIYV